MVSLAQLVRASDCGSEGRGFDPHISPKARKYYCFRAFFISDIMAAIIDSDTAAWLQSLAARYNTPDFIADDPVQFPRMFTEPRDIEIVSLVVSTIAWGNRTMICNSARKMLSLMDWKPYDYVAERGYEELPEGNIHRTFFNRNFRHYLRGLHRVYNKYGSLEGLAAACGAPASDAPAWTLADALNRELAAANDGCADSRCLPLNLDKSALKRFNMALRWLVRNDGIVDLGIWTALTPAQLYIPLDVHVGNTSRALGLLDRKANDRRSVELLTDTLRTLDPTDPVRFDFALFGAGVNAKKDE